MASMRGLSTPDLIHITLARKATPRCHWSIEQVNTGVHILGGSYQLSTELGRVQRRVYDAVSDTEIKLVFVIFSAYRKDGLWSS